MAGLLRRSRFNSTILLLGSIQILTTVSLKGNCIEIVLKYTMYKYVQGQFKKFLG